MAHMQHSAKGTTWEKRGHRWVRRVKTPEGKWKYFYKDGGDRYGTYRSAFDPNSKMTYRKTDDIFDGQTRYKIDSFSRDKQLGMGPRTGSSEEYDLREGKLTRATRMASESVDKLANKGKSFLDKFLKK